MLRAFAHHVVCCCDLLEVVGWSLKLVKLQSQQVPTFLLFGGHRSVVQQCYVRLHSTSNDTSNNVAPAHAHYMPRIHTNTCACMELWVFVSQSPLYSHLKTQHVVTCCDHLHTSANIAQQETTMLAQQCCVLLRPFARAFILQADKFLKCDWLRPEVFKPNLKYLHVKITPVTLSTKFLCLVV